MDKDEIDRQVAGLHDMLGARLHLRGKSFPARMKRAGRLLPKRVHRAGQAITEAQARAVHPKLARLNDPDAFARSVSTIRDYLATIDPRERRINMVLGILGGLVFNLIVLVLGVVMLLRWQGVI